MTVEIVRSVEDEPREASDAPAMITPDVITQIASECVDIENSSNAVTSSVFVMDESPEVKRATEKIVSNSVSIDVIVPASREESAKINGFSSNGKLDSKSSLMVQDEKNEKVQKKDDNVLLRYFRRKTAGLTRTQIAILCIFPFVEFFAATVISIQGPFYPKVAREKGVTPPEYGLVFGSFELVVFIMAPIYGAKMGILNPHRLFNYGIFTTSSTCILFGFVNYINNRTGFFLLSLIIRVVEAIGDAAFVTASFSIIAIEFPDSVATTFAMMETFYGLGMIAGPTVGGALFGIGGFTLPFAVMGGLLLISALATHQFITRVSTTDTKNIVANSSFGMFNMLKVPAIALTAYGTFAAATGIGFLVNNLEHHLEAFELSEFQVGCIFMLNGGVYALSAPLWGRLCDSSKELKVYSVVGSLFTIFGFVLIGPLPFFPTWSPSILVVCIGLVIFGLGLGSTLVSSFVQFLHDALMNGHADDVNTHGLVSGLWTSMTALGFFVGPTLGGFLDHVVGFRWGTLFILIEQLILIGLLMYFFLGLRKSPSTSEDISSPKDNMDDIVITYALKMNTPKPRPRKKSPSKRLQQQLDAASCEETAPDSTNNPPVAEKIEPAELVEKSITNSEKIANIASIPPTEGYHDEASKSLKTDTVVDQNLSNGLAGDDESSNPTCLSEEDKEKIVCHNGSKKDGLENPSFVPSE